MGMNQVFLQNTAKLLFLSKFTSMDEVASTNAFKVSASTDEYL